MPLEPVVSGNAPNKQEEEERENNEYICCNECRCCDPRGNGITPQDGSVSTLPITSGAGNTHKSSQNDPLTKGKLSDIKLVSIKTGHFNHEESSLMSAVIIELNI